MVEAELVAEVAGMTSQEKFTVGQRVRMTREALDRGLDGRHAKRSKGIVKGIPKRATAAVDPSLLVRIQRDGETFIKTYHMDFWEPDE